MQILVEICYIVRFLAGANLMTKIINVKEVMYMGWVELIPIILVFKGMYLYALLAFLVAVLLIFFDPIFQRFRAQVDEANRYIVITISSGLIAAALSQIFTSMHLLIVSVWFLFYLILGIKISKRIEVINGLK